MASFSDTIQGSFQNVANAALKAQLRTLEQQLSTLETELHHDRRLLAGLLKASTLAVRMVSQEQSLRDTLQQLLAMLSELIPGTWGQICLEPKVAQATSSAELLQPAKPRAETGQSATWKMFIQGRPGERLGELEVFGPPAREPEDWEQDVLEMMTRMAALAIGHGQLSQSLIYQAQHDPLTDLPNRYLLNDRLQQALFLAHRRKTLVAVLLIDLDRFKEVNESLGHPVGDQLLRQVAERFRTCTRQTDTLVRMGGDEFLVVLNGLHETAAAVMVARKLLAILGTPFRVGQREIFLNASAGISLYPQDAENPTTLLQSADSALYRAKAQGHHGPIQCFSPEMTEQALERFELEHQLRGALERDELQLYFQPQVDLVNSAVIGIEALMRWQHPDRGLLLPEKFISLAEQCGLIEDLGGWALREACRQAVAWQESAQRPLRIWVNVSALQFTAPDFVDTVADILRESSLPAAALGLEITESMLMRDLDTASRHLRQLQVHGVQVTVDDFGTGYSSLAYLQRLQLDGLKIDRAFVRELRPGPEGTAPDDADDAQGRSGAGALIEGVVRLAQSLSLHVIAEGVETAWQRDFLHRIGCDSAQGFLFSVPQPAAALWPVIQELEMLRADA